MIRKLTLIAASLATVVNGAQPGAPAPVAAPMRDLEWGQINFLHTTDTHGWLGGHLQEAQYSSDWGDYVSFTEHMRKKADEKGVDLLVIDTGDRIEGNGLYDGSEPKGKYISDIFAQQTVDILCTGNHELYHADSVAREHEITVPRFRDAYLASNLDYVEPETGNQIPQARRYVSFTTKNQGLRVVALGFLFDFDRNANNSVVVPVEDVVRESWFREAIREKPDVFVVIGHVGLRMKEFELIYKVIRDENWFTPIVFLGGHAHVRDARRFDDKAVAIASGRYFETIGWISVDGIKKKKNSENTHKEKETTTSSADNITFKRRYIDNNLLNLQHHAGIPSAQDFPTPHGRNVSAMITTARRALNLDHKIGCSPRNLWMTRTPYPSEGSIYSWLKESVLPQAVINETRKEKARSIILNTGAVRFDIFQGAFTKDSTFLVSPFTSTFRYVPDVPLGVARKVLSLLNGGGTVFSTAQGKGKGNKGVRMSLDTRFLNIPEQMAPSPYLGAESSREGLRLRLFHDTVQGQIPLQQPYPKKNEEKELTPGYTTKDDLGTDGDDAVHSPIRFYSVPNCIQAEVFPSSSPSHSPNTQIEEEEEEEQVVDLVFIDYVEPWIIPALRFSGADYDDDDIEPYLDETLTDVIARWVGENWADGC